MDVVQFVSRGTFICLIFIRDGDASEIQSI